LKRLRRALGGQLRQDGERAIPASQGFGWRQGIPFQVGRDREAKARIEDRASGGSFLAAIDDIFQSRAERWNELLASRPTAEQAAKAMVAYEAKHQGEFGFYRVVFTALVEADDPEIRQAITVMYRRFHERIRTLIDAGREEVDERAYRLLGIV